MKRSQLLISLVVVLALLIIILNYYVSNNYNSIIFFVSTLISIVVAITILFGNKKTESKIAWTLFVLFVPIIGFLFYMLLGVEYSHFKKYKRVDVNNLFDDDLYDDNLNLKKYQSISNLIVNTNNNFPTYNNNTKILTNGDEKFNLLLEKLNEAENFINMEYFIIKEGYLFNKVKKILINKAISGVKVRIIYDDFGCIDLSCETINELEKYGIKCVCFNKVSLNIFKPSVNYRNHRKIVVIDNKIGFVGGINIGDEYIHLDNYYGFWRDTHLMIEGAAVYELNKVFITDWYYTTNEKIKNTKYLKENENKQGKAIVQIITDGPDNNMEIIRNAFFKMINNAKKSVWLTTPYLVLDETMLTALKVAALSGIDVRIIVPGLHDKNKKTVYLATQSNFSTLLESGVKIYTYTERFIHSKVLIIDDDLASVGTVNFDYRSFDLHFEVSAILYDDPSIEKLITDFEEDLKNSEEIILKEWKRRSKFKKALEAIAGLLSPLL